METKSILNQKVSFQKDTWAPISKEPTIIQVIEAIKSDRFKPSVERLRELFKSDIESYKVEKLRLPAVTFCGIFDGLRQKDKLKIYNQLIVLDIDKLSDDELKKVKDNLQKDEYTLTYWQSPSNYGVKGLVALEFNFNITEENRDGAHKSAFVKLSNYYLTKYGIELDNSGSDTPRLCFLSYDTDLVIKENCNLFLIEESDLKIYKPHKKTENDEKLFITNKRDRLYNPSGKNKNHHRLAIKSLVKYLVRKKISITGDFENWYRIAYALANTFTYDVGEKHYLELCELDGEKYNKTACINMLTYCYENNNGGIKYATIEFLAKEKGYINKIIGEGAFRNGA